VKTIVEPIVCPSREIGSMRQVTGCSPALSERNDSTSSIAAPRSIA
jgi:hypothetical protein